MSSNSTSNISAELGLIAPPGLTLSPYPSSVGMYSMYFDPTLIFWSLRSPLYHLIEFKLGGLIPSIRRIEFSAIDQRSAIVNPTLSSAFGFGPVPQR